jgi:hypothetical protein
MILKGVLKVSHNQHEIFNGLPKRSRLDSFNLNHNKFDMKINKTKNCDFHF